MGVAMLWWAFAAAAPAAAAPAAPPPPDTPEAIIVTGERVKRSLKETPSSVAVFDKRDIDRLAAPDRIQQLLEFIPNVLQTSARDTPVIRGQISAGELAGLPAFLGGARPRTVVQVDGRTIIFNEFANSSEGLWDVSRVEVFRSPQTTTQGANSIGGAIFITTADPTSHPEARLRAIAGQPHRRQVSGVLSGPLAGDQLAIRVAGDLYRGRAANEMAGPVEGVDLNDDRYGVARVKLLAKPHAIPGLRLLLTVSHERSAAPQGEAARRPFSDRRDLPCICGYFRDTVDSASALVTYPLTSALESRTTLARGTTFFRRFAVHGFGETQIHGRDRSVESVLQWQPGGSLEAIGGIALQRNDLDQAIDLTVTPFGTGVFDDRQDSRGFFGEITWRAAPRLSLTGGLRYQSDRKRRTGVLHTKPDLPLEFDGTDHAFLPKISASYDLNDAVRIGVLIQRAYNPGGVTLEPEHFAVVTFDPEYLWDYEAFTRSTFLGGAVSVTGNVFYNAMRNAQRTLAVTLDTPTGPVGLAEIANAPRARSYGAELEVATTIGQRLTLRGGAGLLRSRVTRTIDPEDPILGKAFLGSPRFTGFAAADWQAAEKLHLTSQVRHYSSYFNDEAASSDTRLQPSTIVDVRAAWSVQRFTVFAYAQNLFDQFRITFWGGPPADPETEVITNDPREIGVGVEAKF